MHTKEAEYAQTGEPVQCPGPLPFAVAQDAQWRAVERAVPLNLSRLHVRRNRSGSCHSALEPNCR